MAMRLISILCLVLASQPVLPGELFRTVYVRFGSSNDEGLLYEPVTLGANQRIALLYTHPSGNNFNVEVGPAMANRGYRVLMVNHHGEEGSPAVYVAGISQGIQYLRTLPGVQSVVIVGHSGGGHLIAFYANVAEHGAAGCQGVEKLYSCGDDEVSGLAKPDGVVLLDPTLGAFHQMSSIDPAVDGKTRNAALDMFAAANGYNEAAKRATYSREFARRFYAAQTARNTRIVDNALERLKAINQGKGEFTDDEPLVIPGMGVNATGARLYQPDVSFGSRTKRPHTLLKADGTAPEVIAPSIRPPSGLQTRAALGTLNAMTQNTTVRRFLANSAIRTTPNFAITADDIVGVNWRSSINSTPGNAEGITVPTLVLSMSCHYLVVPGEIIYDHLAAKDKAFAVVEGAVHNFTPCKPEYGDTVKRTFDYVDGWLAKEGRFSARYIDAQSHFVLPNVSPDEEIARFKKAGVAAVILMDSDPELLQSVAKRYPGYVIPFISVARTSDTPGLRLDDHTAAVFAQLLDAGAVCGFGEIPTRLDPNPEPSDDVALTNLGGLSLGAIQFEGKTLSARSVARCVRRHCLCGSYI